METIKKENKTYRVDIDGSVIHHRKNEDGTVTMYLDGVMKQAIAEISEKAPNFFNVLTDPEDDGPVMVIVDPNKVSLTIGLGAPIIGFHIADPCPEDCEACENRDTCENSLAKKEDDPDE